MSKLGKIRSLFCTFFRIGAFTFGGGYAMIPLIQRETAEKRHWIAEDDILEIIAVAESTPGPIAVNSATFVGYRVAGFWGAFAATCGVVLPSFIIIFIVSSFYEAFSASLAVRYAFFGIRAAVVALILKALVGMIKKAPKNLFSYILALVAFLSVAVLHINAFLVILGAGLLGFAYALLAKKGAKS